MRWNAERPPTPPPAAPVAQWGERWRGPVAAVVLTLLGLAALGRFLRVVLWEGPAGVAVYESTLRLVTVFGALLFLPGSVIAARIWSMCVRS